MDKPKTTDCRPTLVERLERLVWSVDNEGRWDATEDYRVIRQALQQVDYMNRPKVVSEESERLCGTDLDDDYSDLREPMQ
jgi:hypothetical protein